MTTMNNPAIRRKFPPEVYTPDEISRLVKACGMRSRTSYRNRALIVCLWRSGMRLSEALGLLPKDLDRANGTVRILHGKGDKSRVVGMDDAAFAEVARWLTFRASLGIGARSPLFCTMAGGRLATAYLRALLPRLARRAGIEKRVHAHGFRHSAACELAQSGIELRIISSQLGHENVATTDRYLRHLNPQEVIEAMRNRKPFLLN